MMFSSGELRFSITGQIFPLENWAPFLMDGGDSVEGSQRQG